MTTPNIYGQGNATSSAAMPGTGMAGHQVAENHNRPGEWGRFVGQGRIVADVPVTQVLGYGKLSR